MPLSLSGVALDLMLEALGDNAGQGMAPERARGRQNGLDCTGAQAGALLYQDPGIQGTAQVEGDLTLLGPTINQTTA